MHVSIYNCTSKDVSNLFFLNKFNDASITNGTKLLVVSYSSNEKVYIKF